MKQNAILKRIKKKKKKHFKIDSKSDSRLHSMFYNMPEYEGVFIIILFWCILCNCIFVANALSIHCPYCCRGGSRGRAPP